MKYILTAFIIIMIGGCATWNGIKQDSKSGVNWTKQKVNQGATYIEKKTE